MLRSGKELKVFTVKEQRPEEVYAGSKKVRRSLLCPCRPKNKDPNAEVDVIARAEDASKISRIAGRFKLASEATASVVTDVEKSQRRKRQVSQSQTSAYRTRQRRTSS
ncbi:MAG: DUF3801 domain-containing protein [Blautia faecis]